MNLSGEELLTRVERLEQLANELPEKGDDAGVGSDLDRSLLIQRRLLDTLRERLFQLEAWHHQAVDELSLLDDQSKQLEQALRWHRRRRDALQQMLEQRRSWLQEAREGEIRRKTAMDRLEQLRDTMVSEDTPPYLQEMETSESLLRLREMAILLRSHGVHSVKGLLSYLRRLRVQILADLRRLSRSPGYRAGLLLDRRLELEPVHIDESSLLHRQREAKAELEEAVASREAEARIAEAELKASVVANGWIDGESQGAERWRQISAASRAQHRLKMIEIKASLARAEHDAVEAEARLRAGWVRDMWLEGEQAARELWLSLMEGGAA